MTQAKHTPGPWDYSARLSASENHRGYRIWEHGDSWVLADVMPMDEDGKQGEANARLIAAAPELLEALRGLLPQTFTGNPTQAELTAHWERERDLGNGMAPFVLAAYAAIAKAEGQS